MSPIVRMIAGRLALGVLTLVLVSLVIFMAVELLPGDIAQEILGQSATPETVAAFRAELGLDQSPPIRYLNWLGGVLTGDLGNSLATGRDISSMIFDRFLQMSKKRMWLLWYPLSTGEM